MVNAFLKGEVWQKFSRLESEFVDATQYFPLEKKHDQIWSKFFGDLLVRTGNSVDGVFRLMIKEESFNSYPHVKDLMVSGRKRNINFFRDFFEPIYELSGVGVKIAYEHTVYDDQSYPFEEFRNGQNPGWWTSYNHVKHEEFESIKEATLENTIEALAGLFTLNILHWQNQSYLVRETDVFYAEYMRKEDMATYLRESMIGVPKSLSAWRIEAKTPLFAHVLRVDKSAEGSPLMLDDDNSL